jgi:LysM repeat protein
MILAGRPRRNVETLEDKRDKKALGMALVTVPISIVGALSGAETGLAAENTSDADQNSQANGTNSGQTSSQMNLTAAPISRATQLSYTVRAGDTVSKIARKFQLSTNQLIQINKLGAKALIVPGQKLKLIGDAVEPAVQKKADAATMHVVKRGETISSIAKAYKISITTVLAMNKLSAAAIIFPGQRLVIGSVIPKTIKPVQPEEHTLQPGETLASIANLYGVNLNSILELNGLTESSLIYSGLKIKLTASQVKPVEPPKVVAKQKPVATPLSGGLSSTDPHRPTNVCETHGYHTVKAGESVGKIAAIYGVPTQSVLSENGLTWSAMIFIGQKLSIPGVHEIKFCPDLTKMTAEMRSNAQIIYKIGRGLGISDYGIVIALATAMQESGLRNINYGDRDSVGLFQQRPSAHWGSVSQIMNPEYSARAFFGGRTSPTYGAARGLLDIKNWSAMSLTQAAQAVQISAYPNAYAKWEASAWVWLDEIMLAGGQENKSDA